MHILSYVSLVLNSINRKQKFNMTKARRNQINNLCAQSLKSFQFENHKANTLPFSPVCHTSCTSTFTLCKIKHMKIFSQHRIHNTCEIWTIYLQLRHKVSAFVPSIRLTIPNCPFTSSLFYYIRSRQYRTRLIYCHIPYSTFTFPYIQYESGKKICGVEKWN